MELVVFFHYLTDENGMFFIVFRKYIIKINERNNMKILNEKYIYCASILGYQFFIKEITAMPLNDKDCFSQIPSVDIFYFY